MAISIIIVCSVIAVMWFVSRKHTKPNTSKKIDIHFNGQQYTVDTGKVEISDEHIENAKRELEAIQSENREWERQFSILMGHQGRGIELEKQKDVDSAISEYEQAISYGKTASKLSVNNYQYSAERLMVLYRKRKEYDKEIAIIEDMLSLNLSEKDRSEFEYRLSRVSSLKNKNNEQ